jgi:hypothetical protein
MMIASASTRRYSVGVKSLLLISLLAMPATAEWPRLVINQGMRVDHPGTHPLKYFTEFPWRQSNGEPCSPCSPKDMDWARANKARVELKLVGRVHGFDVHDLFYSLGDDPRPGLKSILVQTGLDAFQEIYHDEPNEGRPNPSFLAKASNDTLLCVADYVYRWDAEEECFWFGADGIVRLDFTPIWRAAQNAVPAGRSIWEYGLKAKETFDAMTLAVGIRYKESNRCCDLGVVSVRFELNQGRVIVIGTEFDPDAEYKW